MEPGLLILLLYLMIAHELVSGWMQHRRQSGRARARTGAPPRRQSGRGRARTGAPPSTRAQVSAGGWRVGQSQRLDGVRELRKSGRIVRKA